MPSVVIGGQTVAVPQLNGWKFFRALDVVSGIAQQVPDLLGRVADFNLDYRERNAFVLTPELAKLPAYQREEVAEDGTVRLVPAFTDADFEAAGGNIRIPQEPGTADQLAFVVPIVWGVARDSLVELLAVVLAPSDQLADAEDSGEVEGYLAQRGRELLRKTSPGELLNIAATVADVLASEIRGAGGEALERILAAVTGPVKPEADAPAEPTSTPPSQTDSPEPTGGAADSPFTAPPTANSAPASSG